MSASEQDWYFLDIDNRVDMPDVPHCCRCGRKMKTANISFTVCETTEIEGAIFFRLNPFGREVIGADCLKQQLKPENKYERI